MILDHTTGRFCLRPIISFELFTTCLGICKDDDAEKVRALFEKRSSYLSYPSKGQWTLEFSTLR